MLPGSSGHSVELVAGITVGAGFFAEMAIGFQGQNLFEMAKAGKGGHKVDLPAAAGFLYAQQIFGPKGAAVATDGGMAGKGEHVFDVELQLVDAPTGQ